LLQQIGLRSLNWLETPHRIRALGFRIEKPRRSSKKKIHKKK